MRRRAACGVAMWSRSARSGRRACSGTCCSPVPRARAALSLKSGRQVRVHHGSGGDGVAAAARRRQLGPGESTPARLRFARPVFGLAGDRLVLRDASGRHTLAGGVLLDPAPPPTLRAAQRALLSGAGGGFHGSGLHPHRAAPAQVPAAGDARGADLLERARAGSRPRAARRRVSR